MNFHFELREPRRYRAATPASVSRNSTGESCVVHHQTMQSSVALIFFAAVSAAPAKPRSRQRRRRPQETVARSFNVRIARVGARVRLGGWAL